MTHENTASIQTEENDLTKEEMLVDYLVTERKLNPAQDGFAASILEEAEAIRDARPPQNSNALGTWLSMLESTDGYSTIRLATISMMIELVMSKSTTVMKGAFRFDLPDCTFPDEIRTEQAFVDASVSHVERIVDYLKARRTFAEEDKGEFGYMAREDFLNLEKSSEGWCLLVLVDNYSRDLMSRVSRLLWPLYSEQG